MLYLGKYYSTIHIQSKAYMQKASQYSRVPTQINFKNLISNKLNQKLKPGEN